MDRSQTQLNSCYDSLHAGRELYIIKRHNSVALLTLISYPIKIRHYFLSCEGLLVLLRKYPR
jgi:hypothetical protein